MSLTILALIVLVPAVIWIATWIGRRRVTVPTCRRCRYDLSGGSPERCPECGVVFEVVPPIPAGSRPPMGTLRRLVVLTIVVAALTPLVSGGLVPRLVKPLRSWTTPITLSRPMSGAYDSLTISGTGASRRPFPEIEPETATVTLVDHQGTVHVLAVSRSSMTATSTPATGAGGGGSWPLGERDNRTGDAILAWMTACGVTGDAVALRREADSVAAHLHNADRKQYLRFLPGTGVIPPSNERFWPAYPFARKRTQAAMTNVTDRLRLLLQVGGPVLIWLGPAAAIVAAATRRRRRETPPA